MSDEKQEDVKKSVDESWKDAVKKEAAQTKDGETPAMEVSFGLFITGLMMEALIALGELEHPVTKKKESNTQHARILIDTLEMLQKKTKGNLSKDEEEAMEAMLYDLRMRFVNKVNKPAEK